MSAADWKAMNAYEANAELTSRLEARYPRDKGWCWFTEVPMGQWAGRRADGLALNLSSKSLSLEGFEIKVTRSDWLTELRQPQKATEGLMPYVNRWWLVVPTMDLVKENEVPAGWGVLAPRGKNMVAKIQARPNLTPNKLTPYVCSVLIRRMWDENKRKRQDEIQSLAKELAGDLGASRIEEIERAAKKGSVDEIRQLRQAIREIQETLGIKLVEEQTGSSWVHRNLDWNGLSRWKLASVIRTLMGESRDGDDHRVAEVVGRAQTQIKHQMRSLGETMETMNKLIENHGGEVES